ncbi:hypothetical protein EniLVp02_0163 [Vibrio phage EniLVp02]
MTAVKKNDGKRLLTLKEMHNLSTEDLKAYKKRFTSKIGHLFNVVRAGNATNGQYKHLRILRNHYRVINSILNTRAMLDGEGRK